MKKLISTLLIALSVSLASPVATSQRYVGGDVSLLPEYENAGAVYKDWDGKPVSQLLPWLHEQGMNAMRVRLFVNPDRYKELHQGDKDNSTKYDPNACQDLEYIIPLCQRIVDDGFSLMLDFHYSDTWADPAKQWTPIDWKDLTDEELYEKIYEYTKETLVTLKEAGVVPAFIQPGNEISYGMMWGQPGDTNLKKTYMGSKANWERFGKLLSNAIKACREECPDAKIVLHTERTAQIDVMDNFYDEMKELGVDYDIIGLSYYPYFHGDMDVLGNALENLQDRYPDKKIMIVETGYSYKWEVPGTTHDFTNKWPYSDEGQNAFARDLVNELLKFENVDGLFWWWLEYNAYNTTLSGWYNAPLFDSLTGKATSALKTICSFGESAGLNDILIDTEGDGDNKWYDLQGRPVNGMPDKPGIFVSKKKKILIN